jgi:hypothetical protein
MAQKEDNKEKQLKQKQKQYQKQSVVVNVNTATKRRATGKKSPRLERQRRGSCVRSTVDSIHTTAIQPSNDVRSVEHLTQDSEPHLSKRDPQRYFFKRGKRKNVANNNKREALADTAGESLTKPFSADQSVSVKVSVRGRAASCARISATAR